MVEKNEKNIEKLAEEILNEMDMETLLDFAKEHIINGIKEISTEEFNEEWNFVFNEKQVFKKPE